VLPCPDVSVSSGSCTRESVMKKLRWDKADLISYYNLSYQYLSAIDVPLALLNGVCCVDYEYYKVQINTFYHNIVQALTLSAESSVPSCKKTFSNFGGMSNVKF